MSERPHRRNFVRTVVLGASAASLSAPVVAASDDPKKGTEKAEPPKSAPKTETEADARMDLVLARFGKHLDANARKTVRAEVDSIVRRAEALRKFPLDNGDGPFPVFTPYRAPAGLDNPTRRDAGDEEE